VAVRLHTFIPKVMGSNLGRNTSNSERFSYGLAYFFLEYPWTVLRSLRGYSLENYLKLIIHLSAHTVKLYIHIRWVKALCYKPEGRGFES
jgi:hypothetical protein